MRQNYSRIFARRIRPTYTKYSTLDLGSSLQHASEARRSTGEDGGWISINNSDLCPKGHFLNSPSPQKLYLAKASPTVQAERACQDGGRREAGSPEGRDRRNSVYDSWSWKGAHNTYAGCSSSQTSQASPVSSRMSTSLVRHIADILQSILCLHH